MIAPDIEPGCILDPVHWLRHAIAPTNVRIAGIDDSPDRLSSESLLNALEHFAEQDDWRTVTLLEVTQYASLMGRQFERSCTCGFDPDKPPRSLPEW